MAFCHSDRGHFYVEFIQTYCTCSREGEKGTTCAMCVQKTCSAVTCVAVGMKSIRNLYSWSFGFCIFLIIIIAIVTESKSMSVCVCVEVCLYVVHGAVV